MRLALDPTKMDEAINQVKDRVEFRHRRTIEIKAELERLTTTAFGELLEATELKNVVEGLREHCVRPLSEGGSGPGAEAETPPLEDAGQSGRRARELDAQLEKLLIIKALLEKTIASLPRTVAQAPRPPGPDGKKKILVVDDDRTTVKIITHFLEQENLTVSSSLSGVEGLKRAFRECPDLIILDIMMPDLNGFQFLSIYREDGEGRETPVVILSSLSEESDVLKGLDLGAVDYINKPFSPQVLVAKVKKKLDERP
jgi:CheY-like chemotaxis protein